MAYAKPKKLRAVFYARVSTEEEKQLNALEKQIQENRDVIAQKGWELVDEYIDEGKSGTKVKGRNEYQRLLDDLESDKFDVEILQYHEYGKTKWEQNGLEYKVSDGFVSSERVKKLKEALENENIKIIKT